MKKSVKKRVVKTKAKTKIRAEKAALRGAKQAKKIAHAKDQEPRRRYFEHDGLRLHYWEWGDPREETYVFVHGVRDQGRSWDHFLDALDAPRRADQACGRSRPARPWRQRLAEHQPRLRARGFSHRSRRAC